LFRCFLVEKRKEAVPKGTASLKPGRDWTEHALMDFGMPTVTLV